MTLVAEGVAVGATGVGVGPQMGTVIGRDISGVDLLVSPPPDWHPAPLQTVGSRVGSKHKVGTGVNVWVALRSVLRDEPMEPSPKTVGQHPSAAASRWRPLAYPSPPRHDEYRQNSPHSARLATRRFG